MQQRLDNLRKKFRACGVSNFVVTKFSDIHSEQSSNIRYLSGFSGSNSLLFVTPRDAYLITDGRYTSQAREQVQGAQVFTYSGGTSLADSFVKELRENKAIRFRGRVGFEVGRATVDFHQCFTRSFPNAPLVELRDVVEKISAIKDDSEIAATRKACAITDRVFESLLHDIKPGMAESEIAAELTYRHRNFGAEKDAFDSIVASGERSALPHGRASDKKLKKGDFLTLDFGCFADSYCSDMTRTVVIGKASAEQKKIYRTVLEAQERAVDAVRAGKTCEEMDGIARKIITDAGYGKNFTHGLGHGIGLEVHTAPRLGAGNKLALAAGMIITIEPGVYVPGFGGVRIEDDVVVREDGGEVLTKSPKHLIEL